MFILLEISYENNQIDVNRIIRMGYKLVDYKNLSPNIHETVYLAE